MESILSRLSQMDSEIWTYSLVALLLAHIIADFALRNEFPKNGRKHPAQRAIFHLTVFLTISFAVLIARLDLRLHYMHVLMILLAGTFIHWLIDTSFAHSSMWSDSIGSRQRCLFIIQLLIKLLMLIILATVLTICFSAPKSTWHFQPSDWQSLRVLAYFFGYAFALYVGDVFVSFMLTQVVWKPSSKNGGLPGAGRIIGIFESLLITTFILSYQYSAIGLVLTAKSVARFEWLKEQRKAEYFLIGSLSNLIIAMLAGILSLWLAGQHLFPKQIH